MGLLWCLDYYIWIQGMWIPSSTARLTASRPDLHIHGPRSWGVHSLRPQLKNQKKKGCSALV